MRIHGDLPKTACKRPCYDCPFRTDIKSYMSAGLVAMNTAELQAKDGITSCHHSAKQVKNGNRTRTVACAGFLTVVANARPPLSNYWLESHEFDTNHGVPCFESIGEFYKAVCSIDTLAGRTLAWLECQPAHVRDRYEAAKA